MRRVFALLLAIALVFVLWGFSTQQDAFKARGIAEQRVSEVIRDGTNTLDLGDLNALRKLPRNLGKIPNLEYLMLRGTKVNDLTGLQASSTLRQLDLNLTHVNDLKPLRGLPNLSVLYLNETWVSDLSPLATLPSLARLDLGRTQTNTLQPLINLPALEWLNLHASHAKDGSQKYFETLKRRKGLQISGGAAFRKNYRPHWIYTASLYLTRVKMRYGFQRVR